MKLIFLQLNEINFEIVQEYLKKGVILNGFKQIINDNLIHTKSEKKYELLEPWIQWPSAHTGKSFEEHGIFRLGDSVNCKDDQIFEKIENLGFKVGAISPMNSSNNLKNPSYFIPDPWTQTNHDGSFLSKIVYESLSQAVNDNSEGKITLKTYVYLILSIPFHLLDSINPDILNEISTNVWLNVLFFLVFVFFAFSFFGYYELTLPSKWTNYSSNAEGAGGIFGVFFMALTLSIVSFSCTGPILGSLLAGSLSSDGGAWQLSAGMGGFGLALGLPFALFAMFPNMLRALPKSGGWLNTTKVVLGFLELALAFKFLSNADLVQHWGLLKIEVFLGIWILIFFGLALYIFGLLRFPHDSPLKKLSFLRLSSGILVLAFVTYLGTGFKFNTATNTFTPLTLLSGLAPPVGHSILYPNDTPNNFKSFKDFKKGVAYAKKVNKPILLDFTGYACVNCRKMEEIIWPKPSISRYFEKEYVLISLYVDDKKELPESQKISVKRLDGGSRVLSNYGHKWAHFQTEFFQSNSQPFYVILSSDAKIELGPKVGYTPAETDYEAFLKIGLENFKAL